LTTLKTDLEIISSEVKYSNEPLQYRIRSASKKTAYAITDLKKIAHGLMPGMIINLGVVPSLQGLINDVKAHTGLKIHFFTQGIPERFDPDKELAIYRIAQEALSNVIKHAHAKQVFINLFKKEQTIQVAVEDDGVGFKIDEKMRITSDGGPLGLHIMRERIVQLGGEFTIDSRMGGGTHILAELPL
jgi:signal transduction histidine kinase